MASGTIAFAFVSLLLNSGQASPAHGSSAAVAPASAEVASAQTQADSSKQICKRADAMTGSRIGKRRICKTQAEWDLQRKIQREALDRVQRGAAGPQSGG